MKLFGSLRRRDQHDQHLVRNVERYANSRNCDACGHVMYNKHGIVVKWDNGEMTAKHARCALAAE